MADRGKEVIDAVFGGAGSGATIAGAEGDEETSSAGNTWGVGEGLGETSWGLEGEGLNNARSDTSEELDAEGCNSPETSDAASITSTGISSSSLGGVVVVEGDSLLTWLGLLASGVVFDDDPGFVAGALAGAFFAPLAVEEVAGGAFLAATGAVVLVAAFVCPYLMNTA